MTDILDRLQPGWNEIARQKDVPVFRPGAARKNGVRNRMTRKWFETGEMSIKQANELREAGLLVMAQKRGKRPAVKRIRGVDGKFESPLKPSAEIILLVRRAAA